MRLIILVFGFFFVLSACNHIESETTETYPDGKVKTEVIYQNKGNEKSKIKEQAYFPDGQLASQKLYKNNKPHGEWVFWHSNGNEWSRGFYKHGKRSGESLVFYENGQLFFSGIYKQGEKHDLWKFYNKEGDLVKQVKFNMGEQVASSDSTDLIK